MVSKDYPSFFFADKKEKEVKCYEATKRELDDGLYAVCTDLLDDSVSDILSVSEGRWQVETCLYTGCWKGRSVLNIPAKKSCLN